jgi:MtN3 and saliva related transmembrane protein
VHTMVSKVRRVAADKEGLAPRLEQTMATLGLISPLAAAPQVYKIWMLHQATGLSEFTLGSSVFMALMWTGYGFFHKRKALWMVNGAWMSVNGTMLVGVHMFG